MKALVLCGLTACVAAAPQRPDIRPEDVSAWEGQPISELEMQPLFSTLPRDRRVLSDGREIWDFTNCASATSERQCRAMVNGNMVWSRCAGGETVTACCHNQFIIRANTVESFRPVGSCLTDCTTRPSTKPC